MRRRGEPTALGLALDIAGKRGHLTLHQGHRMECARCGCSGSIDADGKRIGDLFRRDCGRPVGVSTC